MNIHLQILFLLLNLSIFTTSNENEKVMSIYDFEIQSLEGEIINFADFKGKNILIVNTASECGYTPQYADLQELHEIFGDKVTVLGFPANNFGGQEPGSDQQIAKFCEKNYGVTFPMFSKMEVVGKNQHPLFKFLKEQTGKEPTWNFCKYLVSEEGSEISFYPSSVNPGEIAEKL
ncbi:glutathione peroxidase [Marivirga salinae]|uniref:Glutathione peroxidase n=1 Tax=Marivirga salinarum TaxID=3059078 RepID=A0AA51NDN0_9BACT|nr:glutathione peroxidase [Marivirga sp. BDSF4-3]WMN11681.1 glutathione peroxidase [Marivirga sp. BDSF4-3]